MSKRGSSSGGGLAAGRAFLRYLARMPIVARIGSSHIRSV